MAVNVVTTLLLSFVPSVALALAGFVLYKFRNPVIACLIFAIGLVLVAYALISLFTSSQELRVALLKGGLPLLVVWSVVHFAIIAALAIRLVWRTV